MSNEEKNTVLEKRNTILDTVKKHIDKKMNPEKCNANDPRRENYVNVPSISETLEELKILELDYYEVLSISSDDDFQIYLKREPSACFTNSCFVEGLQAWKANIYIQAVFNY